ncbi:hypothetical protein [Chryseobacterium gossypii]|uniref:hypothetical protein n=1 Tax=Chryseobacterium gossypii TaxID=3231602 RepID=UPI0035260DED
MKINKIYIICLLIFLIGCKKNISGNTNSDIKETIQIQKKDSISSSSNKLNNFTKESFVISCGSGCAMSYSPENIRSVGKSVKVKFKVDMYLDEVLTDTYEETYMFSYDGSGEVEKINLEGKNENILQTLMPDAQESFREFGNKLMGKENALVKPEENCIKESDLKLPYNNKIDLKTVKYQLLLCNSIKGIEKFICGQDKLRYITLPSKDNISVLLVPQDCGDFSYRFYLITIKNNIVADKLYVEGEWYEPDDEENKEVTYFSIDDKYNIIVKTQISNSITSKKYIIDSNGKIKESN